MTAPRGGKMNYALELPGRCEYCGKARNQCKSRKCKERRAAYHRQQQELPA